MDVEYIPVFLPNIDEKEIEEVVDTLKSGWITTGPKTKLFEDKMRSYFKSGYAIPVNSCTAALHLSLVALEVGKSDEVITTPFTFISTVNVILHQGATPVLIDIDPKTYNIDVTAIEKAITPRTKAIIIVDYGGQPCNFDEIKEIADKHSLRIVEDAAHAVGAEYKGRKVGTFADLTCFSFYATKNLATAEGGMVTTHDYELAERIRILSLHGMSKDAWKRYQANGSWYYEVMVPGYKYNFTDIQASLGLHQLDKLDDSIERRQEIADLYTRELEKMDGIITPYVSSDVKHAWHLYAIQIQEDVCGVDRNEIIRGLQERNVGTSVHFIPVHLHPYYRDTFGYREGDFPVSEKVYSQMVSIPIYPQLTDDNINYIISSIEDLIN